MVMPVSPKDPGARSAALSDPALHRALKRMIAAKIPATDAEDVLQQTLTDALAAAEGPTDSDEIRRWVFGIARHKIADHHRRAQRYELSEAVPEAEATSAPHSAEDLVRWAEGEAPSDIEAKKTLEWMAREADGERLESIAREENIPAPRVRQRVSRLRKFFRRRWAAQIAALGAFALVAALAISWVRRKILAPEIVPERAMRVPERVEEARGLREKAIERCRERAFEDCLKGLDQARALDPIGDEAEAIQSARAAARDAFAPKPPEPAPEPAPSTAPAPSASAAPSPSSAPRGRRTSITSEGPMPKPAPTESYGGGRK